MKQDEGFVVCQKIVIKLLTFPIFGSILFIVMMITV